MYNPKILNIQHEFIVGNKLLPLFFYHSIQINEKAHGILIGILHDMVICNTAVTLE